MESQAELTEINKSLRKSQNKSSKKAFIGLHAPPILSITHNRERNGN